MLEWDRITLEPGERLEFAPDLPKSAKANIMHRCPVSAVESARTMRNGSLVFAVVDGKEIHSRMRIVRTEPQPC